jgi:predicted permease
MADLRYALRQLQSAPGFACAVVVTLALTIGANTTMFSLVHAIVLRPLPVEEPGRIVVLEARSETGQASRPIYYQTYAALSELPVFESLSLYSGGGIFLIEVLGARVEGVIEASTPGLLESLGVRPHVGRFFTDADAPADAPSAAVAVISHDLWTRSFGASPAAVGATIRLNGTPAVVIGVTPREFTGFYGDSGIGFSVPLSFLNRQLGSDPKRAVRGMHAVGRLAPGVSIGQARAAVDAVWPRLRVETVPPDLNATERADVATFRISVDSLAAGFSSLRTQYREPLVIVFAVTAALLLLGCVNLSGLLLARTAARQSQMAVHLALGASRWRLTRQLLLEQALLCSAGAALGLLIAWWTSLAAGQLLWQGSQPLARSLTPDARVVAFAALVTSVTAVLLTLLPAWTIVRYRALDALQPRRTVTQGTGGWSRVLLSAQIAVSFVLVVAAALLAASFVGLRTMSTGVQHDGLRWSRLFAVPNGYRNQDDASYYPELVRRLSEVAGVRSVALAQHFPTYFAYENLVGVEQVSALDTATNETGALMERISPRFFDTVGVPVLRGRDFTWRDTRNAPAVALINERLARALFPAGSAVGRSIRIGKDPSRAAVEVVGVVADAVTGGYKDPHAPVVYRPRMQDVMSPRAPVLLFRASGDAAAVDGAMAKVIDALGHEYARGFYSLDEQIDIALLRERLLASLASFFAAVAVVLTAVGIFSAFALAVARRRRELGVRMALGASRGAVVGMVLREGALVSLAGVALGVPVAIGATGYIASWIYGVAPRDPATLLVGASALVVIGMLACLGPALRASSIDPAAALRVYQ